MTNVEKVTDVLVARYGGVSMRTDYGWPTAALSVIDCVLSLNRPYEKFVRPRVEEFSQRNPLVGTVEELSASVRRCESPLAFCESQLRYRDARRATTLVGVIDYLRDVLVEFDGANEAQRLQQWAVSSRPGDFLTVGVPGFGLAGFQYLRMLFGAQTTKPDVHIIRFVSEVIGRQITAVQALNILERAAKFAKLPLREIDAEIWKERATQR